MEGSRFDHEDEEDHTTITATTTTTNDHSSVLSGDDEAAAEEEEEEEYVPSPKKRKGANKKRVEVPIGNGSSRSSGEVYPIPPQDSWSWRKYGQKPIKGSPYPRGYYRCSSSKGCPARKQVERSRLNPTTLLITYAGDHNHPLPATTKNHHHHHHHNQHPNVSAAVTISTPPHSSTTNTTHPANFPPEECTAFANQQDIEPDKNGFKELAGEFGWLCDVGPTFMDLGPTYAYTDVEVLMPIGEEDKLLFGDLGDLPESSLVFRRHALETPCCSASG